MSCSYGEIKSALGVVWVLQRWEKPLRVPFRSFWSLFQANNEEHWFKLALEQPYSCSVEWSGQVHKCFDCLFSLKSKFSLRCFTTKCNTHKKTAPPLQNFFSKDKKIPLLFFYLSLHWFNIVDWIPGPWKLMKSVTVYREQHNEDPIPFLAHCLLVLISLWA